MHGRCPVAAVLALVGAASGYSSVIETQFQWPYMSAVQSAQYEADRSMSFAASTASGPELWPLGHVLEVTIVVRTLKAHWFDRYPPRVCTML